jgi:rhodanese-related sulfurtransferase
MLKLHRCTVTIARAALVLLLAVLPAIAAETQGTIKGISSRAKILAVTVPDGGITVFTFGDQTTLRDAASVAELYPDDQVAVVSVADGPRKKATAISRVIAELPYGIEATSLAAVEQLTAGDAAAGGPLLVDARSGEEYAAGHLPNAVSAPFEELKKQGGELILPQDPGRPLVFYGQGPTSLLAGKAANLARRYGYANVRVFPEGVQGWQKSGAGLVATTGFVKSGDAVLIDLRSPAQVRGGHIPRAVNITLAKLSEARQQFPADKSAPIVFYGGNAQELASAVTMVREWGYPNAAAYPGGISAWTAAGNGRNLGPTETAIRYNRKRGTGEITVRDFNLALRSTSVVLILDARSPEEFAKGHYPKAVNIPVAELEQRIGEIPPGKIVVVHCHTGNRAEMAYEILRQRKIPTQYLRATVEFGPDGKATITE